MKQSGKNYKRIVVKVGSSLFYDSRGRLDFRLLAGICSQAAALKKAGKEVILVSSGAIALGMSLLKISARPKELSFLQAAASLGQNELMDVYRRVFGRYRMLCGQVLLTWDDFSGRSRYLNAKNTLNTLLKLGIVPVVNENDTVSTEEIKFGDNDRLSALVAGVAEADLLLILSDVQGLLDRDRKTLVRLVESINEHVLSLATSTGRQTSVGGMITKLKAARVSVDAGIPCVIAAGRSKDILIRISGNPAAEGTLFVPKAVPLNQLHHWMAYSTKPAGTVTVDDGAASALLNKKSLLSVGVTDCSGAFKAGDVVSVVDKRDKEIARGRVSLSSVQLEAVKGSRSDKEVIHCDNLVVI